MTKILLVEDDKSLREIYGVRLMAEGYEITSAGDGEEALAMAIKERPGLIVSDVMMPKISGFDMLDILRSTSETKDIKVIMMTALSSEDQRARGESLGADRYLVKSQVGIEDVVRTVHEVLGDSPTQAPTPAQQFGTPAPSAAPRPASPAAVLPRPETETPPTPQTTTTPAPVINTPPAPEPTPAPAPTPTPAPETGLPQPTAPFSTDRPASLGDRVINPPPSSSQSQTPAQDIGSMMNQELNAANGTPAPTQPTPNQTPAPEGQTPPTPSAPTQ